MVDREFNQHKMQRALRLGERSYINAICNNSLLGFSCITLDSSVCITENISDSVTGLLYSPGLLHRPCVCLLSPGHWRQSSHPGQLAGKGI